MFRKIAVPFDLAHADLQAKAIRTAADLAKHYNASPTLVGLTSNTPSTVAHHPEECAQKLADYAVSQSSEHGVTFNAHSTVSVDVTVDLEKKLDERYQANPKRFVHARPTIAMPPDKVLINPISPEEIAEGVSNTVNFPALTRVKEKNTLTLN